MQGDDNGYKYSETNGNALLLGAILALTRIVLHAAGAQAAGAIVVTNLLDELTSGNGCGLCKATTSANNDAQTYAIVRLAAARTPSRLR